MTAAEYDAAQDRLREMMMADAKEIRRRARQEGCCPSYTAGSLKASSARKAVSDATFARISGTVKRMKAAGASNRAIAAKTGVSQETIRRALNRIKEPAA